MSNEQEMPDINPGIPPQQHAVSVYGQSADALDDFPVLKAFQQYVDAEQAKAHKRLMTVCIFFTIVMTIVISVFLIVILGISRGGGSDPALRAISESNAAMQRQMLEQSSRMNEQLMGQLLNRPAAMSSSPIDAEVQKQNLELQARLKAMELEAKMKEREAKADAARRAAEALPEMSEDEMTDRESVIKRRESQQNAMDVKLKAREAKLAEESKRLKEKQIDLQQRNLYPGYFSFEARQKADQEINDARRESKEAEERARAAEEKAIAAERRAADALKKAKEAEKLAIREQKRLAEEKRRLEEEREALSAAAIPAEPTSSAPTVPAAKEGPVVQPDGSLRFFDETEDDELLGDLPPVPSKPAKKGVGAKSSKPAPAVAEKPLNPAPQADGSLRFFDESEYDIPLE